MPLSLVQVRSDDLGPEGSVEYGASAAGPGRVNIPFLTGVSVERLFAGSGLRVKVWRARRGEGDLEQAAFEIYAALLAEVGPEKLVRVWNYVPDINGQEGELERYRRFSMGRARAFEAAWGPGFEARLPAASAVGGPGDELVVIAGWGEGQAVPLENPEQMPAYRYPATYGPRAPSFARATHFLDTQNEWVFISGTAAVRGHASVAPADVAGQLQCTLANLDMMGAQGGAGADLGAGGGWRRDFKVYLRNAADLPVVRAGLGSRWSGECDRITWVQADICRRELLVEIEVTLRRPRAN